MANTIVAAMNALAVAMNATAAKFFEEFCTNLTVGILKPVQIVHFVGFGA
ncbi:MAG: hypothetical protein AAFQ50_04215 [Pseudomonadota bacterium]